MMIAASILYEKSLVVAGRAESAIRQLHRRKNPVFGSAWILNADAPRSIAFVAGHVHVAAELNNEIVKAAFQQNFASSVHGVSFADTTEACDHAIASEKCCTGMLIHNEISVVDQLSPACHFRRVRDRVVLVLIIKLPETGHDAERHIEFSACPFAHLIRCRQQAAEFRSDSNRMLPGSAVQLLNFAVLTPCAHESFEPIEFVGNFVESSDG